MKQGLYSNINAKQARIKAGSGEKMRKAGAKGAPTPAAFKQSAKTARKKWRLRLLREKKARINLAAWTLKAVYPIMQALAAILKRQWSQATTLDGPPF